MDVGSSVPLPLSGAKIVDGQVVQDKPKATSEKAGRAKQAATQAAENAAVAASTDAGTTQGKGKSDVTDTWPMKNVVLGKIASGANPADFSPAEAQTYAELPMYEINAAKEQALKNASANMAGMGGTPPASKAVDQGSISVPTGKDMSPYTPPAVAPSANIAPAAPAASNTAAPLNMAGSGGPSGGSAPWENMTAGPSPLVALPGAESGGMVLPSFGSTQEGVPATPSMPSGKDISKLDGKKLLSVLANIADAIGVGLSARGGVNRQTYLTQQMLQQMATENELAKTKGTLSAETQALAERAPVEEAKAAAIAKTSTDQAIRQKLATLPLETDAQIRAAIAVAQAQGDINTVNALKVYQAEYPYEIEKLQKERELGTFGVLSAADLARARAGK